MNQWKDQSPAESNAGSSKSRKPYQTPKLIKRGSVADLTRGGGSIVDDGLGTLEGVA